MDLVKENLNQTYLKYKEQIDTLASIPNMKERQLARILAWFYGGSEGGWRTVLSSKTRKKRMPEDVRKLLGSFEKGKAK
jgi:uncharacterized protein YfaQ (DUF2300 family)